jgi:hypothetical protein
MWCWKKLDIGWADRMRNEGVLRGVKEERNVLLTVSIRKANWIGQILRRNSLLKHVMGGKIEGKMRKTT